MILEYLKYYVAASNGKGHGIHSPFVYDFVTKVMNDSSRFEPYDAIERVRKRMLANNKVLTIEDFGAGSSVTKSNARKVSQIARSALKPKKFGQLLFRIANHYQPKAVIELGTSLGITTAYLASANTNTNVYTFEGARQVAAIAKENFNNLSLHNIRVIDGNFDDTLPRQLDKLTSVDLAFVDGNHRKKPTVDYFTRLLETATESSVFIFDDIHWSKEMSEAWKCIQQHSAVTLTIDLFFIGIVFFRREQKVQQHFVIRF